MLATLFAVLFGGTFLPVVDWLAAHHLRRWMGAVLVVVFLIALAVGIALVIVYGVVNQIPEIRDRLDQAVTSIRKALDATSVPASTVEKVKDGLSDLTHNAASGAAGAIVGVISGVGTLLFGIFISINIMVWLLTQGREIGAWASRHVGGVPQPVAYRIFSSSAHFFRGYIWGSTIIGLFNGAVLFVGALVIGVPLAATIGIVAWFTNYIPYFGAIISGAFAVLIALGAGGPSKAIPMLVVVIIANGFCRRWSRSSRWARLLAFTRWLCCSRRRPAACLPAPWADLRGAAPQDRRGCLRAASRRRGVGTTLGRRRAGSGGPVDGSGPGPPGHDAPGVPGES